MTIYHGDCREIMSTVEADVLVTDPPYGVDWTANALTWYGSRDKPKVGHVVKDKPAIQRVKGDTDASVRDEILSNWDGPAIVFGSWKVERPPSVRHLLIWHKIGRNPGPLNAPWFLAHEEIYVIGDGFNGKPHQSVYPTTENRALEPGKIGHPTPKPLGLMIELIRKCPEGTILDPFMGSGTTLRAAKDLGRKAIGIEIEEKYCEIAAKRMGQEVLF